MRVGVRLGVDVGTVRIGVARSDPLGHMALPLETVRWLVLVVVVYTAASILLTARRERQLVAASGNE